MFCLRIWLLPLFFLSNASPLYLLLFLSATYFLQRPCVYCSLLLAILVFALFDFQRDWFEPADSAAYIPDATPAAVSDPPRSQAFYKFFGDAASIIATTVNGTANALLDVATQEVQKHVAPSSTWSAFFGFLEWGRGVSGKRELRIPCVNAIIRL